MLDKKDIKFASPILRNFTIHAQVKQEEIVGEGKASKIQTGTPYIPDPDDYIPPQEDNDQDDDGIPNDQDPDDDNDGIPDEEDLDDDNDGVPDTQDPDDDNDGIPDTEEGDNDQDDDGIPDETDPDDDNDGTPDTQDPDDDNDGIPDTQDPDDDNDGIPDEEEPTTDDPDDDNDGIPNDQDPDDDNDGIPDEDDPNNPEGENPDSDEDGIPDTDDPDDDNDGIPNDQDPDDDNDGIPDEDDPNNPEGENPDSDEDGIPDTDDPDDDNDGLPDEVDPDDDNDGIPDEEEPDSDDDGVPDQQDPDDDNDGIPDEQDSDPHDDIPDGENPDSDNDGIPDTQDPDDDNDSVPDEEDPDDDNDGTPDQDEPDFDGDGVPDQQDPDDDNDGIPDEQDSDPHGDIPDGENPDSDGDGIPDPVDPDDDNDGVPDEQDPDDDNDGVPDEQEPDQDNDGIPDEQDPDDDNDGIPDDEDTDKDNDGIPDEEDPDDNNDGVPDIEPIESNVDTEIEERPTNCCRGDQLVIRGVSRSLGVSIKKHELWSGYSNAGGFKIDTINHDNDNLTQVHYLDEQGNTIYEQTYEFVVDTCRFEEEYLYRLVVYGFNSNGQIGNDEFDITFADCARACTSPPDVPPVVVSEDGCTAILEVDPPVLEVCYGEDVKISGVAYGHGCYVTDMYMHPSYNLWVYSSQRKEFFNNIEDGTDELGRPIYKQPFSFIYDTSNMPQSAVGNEMKITVWLHLNNHSWHDAKFTCKILLKECGTDIPEPSEYHLEIVPRTRDRKEICLGDDMDITGKVRSTFPVTDIQCRVKSVIESAIDPTTGEIISPGPSIAALQLPPASVQFHTMANIIEERFEFYESTDTYKPGDRVIIEVFAQDNQGHTTTEDIELVMEDCTDGTLIENKTFSICFPATSDVTYRLSGRTLGGAIAKRHICSMAYQDESGNWQVLDTQEITHDSFVTISVEPSEYEVAFNFDVKLGLLPASAKKKTIQIEVASYDQAGLMIDKDTYHPFMKDCAADGEGGTTDPADESPQSECMTVTIDPKVEEVCYGEYVLIKGKTVSHCGKAILKHMLKVWYNERADIYEDTLFHDPSTNTATVNTANETVYEQTFSFILPTDSFRIKDTLYVEVWGFDNLDDSLAEIDSDAMTIYLRDCETEGNPPGDPNQSDNLVEFTGESVPAEICIGVSVLYKGTVRYSDVELKTVRGRLMVNRAGIYYPVFEKEISITNPVEVGTNAVGNPIYEFAFSFNMTTTNIPLSDAGRMVMVDIWAFSETLAYWDPADPEMLLKNCNASDSPDSDQDGIPDDLDPDDDNDGIPDNQDNDRDNDGIPDDQDPDDDNDGIPDNQDTEDNNNPEEPPADQDGDGETDPGAGDEPPTTTPDPEQNPTADQGILVIPDALPTSHCIGDDLTITGVVKSNGTPVTKVNIQTEWDITVDQDVDIAFTAAESTIFTAPEGTIYEVQFEVSVPTTSIPDTESGDKLKVVIHGFNEAGQDRKQIKYVNLKLCPEPDDPPGPDDPIDPFDPTGETRPWIETVIQVDEMEELVCYGSMYTAKVRIRSRKDPVRYAKIKLYTPGNFPITWEVIEKDIPLSDNTLTGVDENNDPLYEVILTVEFDTNNVDVSKIGKYVAVRAQGKAGSRTDSDEMLGVLIADCRQEFDLPVRNCWQFDGLVVGYFNHVEQELAFIDLDFNALPTEINDGNGCTVRVCLFRGKHVLFQFISGGNNTGNGFQLAGVGLYYKDEYNVSKNLFASHIFEKSLGTAHEGLMLGSFMTEEPSWVDDVRTGRFDTAPSIGSLGDYITLSFGQEWVDKKCSISSSANCDIEEITPPDPTEPGEEDEEEQTQDCYVIDKFVFQYYNELNHWMSNVVVPFEWIKNNFKPAIETPDGIIRLQVHWSQSFMGPVLQINQGLTSHDLQLTGIGIMYKDRTDAVQTIWAEDLSYWTEGVKNESWMKGGPKTKETLPWVSEVENGDYSNAPSVGSTGDYVVGKFNEAFTSTLCPITDDFNGDDELGLDPALGVPEITINHPPLDWCEGMLLTLIGTATEEDRGIEEIIIFIDGVEQIPHIAGEGRNTANFSFNVDTGGLEFGHDIQIKAVAVSLVGKRAEVLVDIVVKNCPPTITVTAPSSVCTGADALTQIVAKDHKGISEVVIYVNGIELKRVPGNGATEMNWSEAIETGSNVNPFTFDFDLEMSLTYPDSGAIDITNFTGEWMQFDEGIVPSTQDANGAITSKDKGLWHGPPESGYPKVTNLANQGYNSGWFNPNHLDLEDYTCQFMCQTLNGDDDMIGIIFRYDHTTHNYYSVCWDAYYSRGSGGVGGVKGLVLLKNICNNPSSYGSSVLQYTRTQLGKVNIGWPYTTSGSPQMKYKVQVAGNNIKVWIHDGTSETLHFDITDTNNPLLKGAWGPVTNSQPNTYFWDFQMQRLRTITPAEEPSFQHAIFTQIPAPVVTDLNLLTQILIQNNNMGTEFANEITNFLANHPAITEADVTYRFDIVNDQSGYPVYFEDVSNAKTSTSNKSDRLYSEVPGVPASTIEICAEVISAADPTRTDKDCDTVSVSNCTPTISVDTISKLCVGVPYQVMGDVSAPGGLNRVEVWMNGVKKGNATVNGSSYQYDLDHGLTSATNHVEILVKVYDNDGRKAEAQTITLCDTCSSLTATAASPVCKGDYIHVEGTAYFESKVHKVECYENGSLLNSVYGGGLKTVPFNFNIPTSNRNVGTYKYKIKSISDSGQSETTLDMIVEVVLCTAPPTIDLNALGTWCVGSNLTIAGSFTAETGAQEVRIFVNNVDKGTATLSGNSFSKTLSNSYTNGTAISVKAVITDTEGRTADNTETTTVVNCPPSITMNPMSTWCSGDPLTVTGGASSNSPISSIVLKDQNGTTLATIVGNNSTSQSYSQNVTGSYSIGSSVTITATVTNAVGLTASASQTVIIQDCGYTPPPVVVTDRNLVLELWDDGAEDNDTLNIYLNGVQLYSNVVLYNSSVWKNITLSPGQNTLNFEGVRSDSGALTVSIRIWDQDKVTNPLAPDTNEFVQHLDGAQSGYYYTDPKPRSTWIITVS